LALLPKARVTEKEGDAFQMTGTIYHR